MIIDLSEYKLAKQPPEVAAKPAPADVPATEATVTVSPEPFDSCKHQSMIVDEKHRTVKCKSCDQTLDPVWCLVQFFHWNRRIDNRVADIREFDKRQARIEELRQQKKRLPRQHLRRRRDDQLARAIQNEYDAKMLALRAARQRERAAKLDEQLDTSVTDEVQAAGIRAGMRSTPKRALTNAPQATEAHEG